MKMFLNILTLQTQGSRFNIGVIFINMVNSVQDWHTKNYFFHVYPIYMDLLRKVSFLYDFLKSGSG